MSTPPDPSPPQAKTRNQLTIFLSALVLLLGAIVLFFIIPSSSPSLASFAPSPTSTATLPFFRLSSGGTVTLTPFQPLPTDTPTPTATSTATPEPTETPIPEPTETPVPTQPPPSVNIPSYSVLISGVHSYPQRHMLSCESRSAVDFAAYFGVDISEDDFLSNLPRSDNPDEGFVGDPDDPIPQLPPNSYGVHAEPVAELLDEYGVSSNGVKEVSLDLIKEEIDHEHPVIAWVVGSVGYGTPREYTASDGSVTTVAYLEHTVLVIGYDEYGLTFMDNGMTYWRDTASFLRSWAALDNMIVYHE